MDILMKNYIDLGFTKIYYYSLMILIGAAIGLFLVYREFKRQGIDSKKLENMVFYTLLIGIIGARIWYVLFNLDYYSENLLEIFAVWNGGLAIHGGVIFGIGFLYFYCRKHKIPLYKIVDICIPALLCGQIVGRWGNFFNMEAHGIEVTRSFLESLCIPDFIIKGMFIQGHYYHPTFLYESLFNFIILIFILIIRRYKHIKEGTVLATYLMSYGFIRFFIEGLRTDSLMLGNIRVAQLISVIFYLLGCILLTKSVYKHKEYNIKEDIIAEKKEVTIKKKTTKKKVK